MGQILDIVAEWENPKEDYLYFLYFVFRQFAKEEDVDAIPFHFKMSEAKNEVLQVRALLDAFTDLNTEAVDYFAKIREAIFPNELTPVSFAYLEAERLLEDVDGFINYEVDNPSDVRTLTAMVDILRYRFLVPQEVCNVTVRTDRFLTALEYYNQCALLQIRAAISLTVKPDTKITLYTPACYTLKQ